MIHDPLCPSQSWSPAPACQCELISKVRVDERNSVVAQFGYIHVFGPGKVAEYPPKQ